MIVEYSNTVIMLSIKYFALLLLLVDSSLSNSDISIKLVLVSKLLLSFPLLDLPNSVDCTTDFNRCIVNNQHALLALHLHVL